DARRIALTLAVKHNVLDDSGEISNILCADWKESGDDSLILQRLRKLIDTNNLGAAVPMISSIIENLGDKPNIESLVVSMLEMMKYNKSKAAPEAAKLLLNFHADQSGNAEEVLHYAIEYLSNLNRLDLARAFLRHLIEQGINPTISNGDIEALFEGDYDLLAKYYFNSMSAPEVNEKSDTSSAFARLALEQFIKSGIWSLDMEVCFAKLIDSNDFSASDLVNLREFDARHGSKRNLVAALILIARKELDGDARIAFCDEAAKSATEKLKDAVLAYEILAECYDGSTDSADIIRIAHAAIPAGRMDHAIQLCLKVISSKDCVSNEQAVMECLDILILDKASRKITSFCCKSLISWCEEMGAKNLLEKIIAFAILNNFASESILQREVIHLIMSGKLNLAVQRVLDAVSHTDQTGESSESLLDGISTELSKENMSAAWAQF
ncbi:MAG: hypothetical protein NTV34_20450, partial [Proteobacteria bacterium]|nr:hypothetical protein [Pseudomonadota bacterium]